jgi:hypothetical protein
MRDAAGKAHVGVKCARACAGSRRCGAHTE